MHAVIKMLQYIKAANYLKVNLLQITFILAHKFSNWGKFKCVHECACGDAICTVFACRYSTHFLSLVNIPTYSATPIVQIIFD